MPATISSSGTWTIPPTPLADKLAETVPVGAIDWNPEEFATLPDELNQFLRLVASGLGSHQGTNKQLDHWVAAQWVAHHLTAHLHRGKPREGTRTTTGVTA